MKSSSFFGRILLLGVLILFPYFSFSSPVIQGPVVPAMYWRSIGGTNIFYTGGWIGIGLNSPNYMLDVFGTGNFLGLRLPTGAANNFILASDASGNARWVTTGSLITETDPQVGTITTNYIPFWNGTSLVTSQIFDNGTNVGIGTASPTRLFEVFNTGTSTMRIRGGTAGSPARRALIELVSDDLVRGQGIITIENGVETWFYGKGYGTNNFTIGYSGSQSEYLANSRLTIAPTGNVGIGNVSPTIRLDVASSGSSIARFQNSNGILQVFQDSGGGGVFTDTIHGWYITPNGTASFLNTGSVVGGGFVIRGTTGNVGIGTAAPTAKLHLAGSGLITSDLQVNGTGTFAGLRLSTGATNNFILASDASGNARWVSTGSLINVPVTSVYGRVGAITATLGDYSGTLITNVPAGNIAAINVQSAINELDTEKANLASPALTGTPTAPTAASGTNNTQIATTAFVSTEISRYTPVQSSRDFITGTLIQTDIDYSVLTGDPWLLEIEGNSYGGLVPFDIKYQGYIYSGSVINHGGISNGTTLSGVVLFNHNGRLHFWFPRQQYWQGFTVSINSSLAGLKRNRLISITSEGKPAGVTKEVALSANIRQSLHSSNFTTYTPSLTGAGASGTWGINISGNAATATNATTATALQTSRTIAGVGFNGTANINIPFANLSSIPTTIAGYGITDAVTLTGDQTIAGNKTFTGDLTVQGRVITDRLVNRTVNNVSISGSLLPDTGAPMVYRDIGNATTQRWNNLYLSGQIFSTIQTGIAPFTVNSTTKVTNLNVDQLDGLDSSYFTDIPGRLGYSPSRASTTSGSVVQTNSLIFADTRAIDYLPQDRNLGLYLDFKQNTTNGLNDGGTYNGVMTLRHYGTSTDLSGGQPMQLSYTANGNLWTRMGTSATTWGSWKRILSTTDYSGITNNYIPRWNGSSLITSSVFDNGTNVGIGTAAPTAKLYLAGSGLITSDLQVNGTGTFAGLRLSTGASLNAILASDASGNARWVSTGSLISATPTPTWTGILNKVETPVLTTNLFGDSDFPVNTTSTGPVSISYLSTPFAHAIGSFSCPAGTTKQHKVVAEIVDNISGAQNVALRIDFAAGTDRDFNLGSGSLVAPYYRTWSSSYFTESNINNATIQVWINGTSGPYVRIRKADLLTFCL